MDFKVYIVLIILVSIILVFLVLFQLGVFNSLMPKAIPTDINGWVALFQSIIQGGSGTVNSLSGTSYLLGIITIVMAIVILYKIIREASSNEKG